MSRGYAATSCSGNQLSCACSGDPPSTKLNCCPGWPGCLLDGDNNSLWDGGGRGAVHNGGRALYPRAQDPRILPGSGGQVGQWGKLIHRCFTFPLRSVTVFALVKAIPHVILHLGLPSIFFFHGGVCALAAVLQGPVSQRPGGKRSRSFAPYTRLRRETLNQGPDL